MPRSERPLGPRTETRGEVLRTFPSRGDRKRGGRKRPRRYERRVLRRGGSRGTSIRTTDLDETGPPLCVVRDVYPTEGVLSKGNLSRGLSAPRRLGGDLDVTPGRTAPLTRTPQSSSPRIRDPTTARSPSSAERVRVTRRLSFGHGKDRDGPGTQVTVHVSSRSRPPSRVADRSGQEVSAGIPGRTVDGGKERLVFGCRENERTGYSLGSRQQRNEP